jgi:hypothetical protein
MQALFTLTPAESKRLIGKGVAALPEVQNAKKNGYLLVARGTTTAYCLEEILGEKIQKERYAVGQTIRGVLCALDAGERTRPVTFHKGEILPVEPNSVADKLGPGDILLKGGNALDAFGNVGVVLVNPSGGTMGVFYMGMKARGLEIIYTVGLEKLIPSVEEAARYGGTMAVGKAIGCKAGLACVADGRPFTEIDALETLFNVSAIHFASGGWGGAEGCVTLVIEGPDAEVGACMEFVEEKIKGEPALPGAKGPCKTCPMGVCSFQGKEEKDLPEYLK